MDTLQVFRTARQREVVVPIITIITHDDKEAQVCTFPQPKAMFRGNTHINQDNVHEEVSHLPITVRLYRKLRVCALRKSTLHR